MFEMIQLFRGLNDYDFFDPIHEICHLAAGAVVMGNVEIEQLPKIGG
ncbi:hypothetical protein [Exiguobacterium marinum]